MAVYPRACGGTQRMAGHLFHRPGLSPRVRGTDRLDRRLDGITGLSPRVRGNRYGIERCHGRRRSIPARAGEPSRCLQS